MELNKSLPNNLSKENQDMLLNEYLKNGSFDARQKIIIHNLKLVTYVINTKITYSNCNHDDLFYTGIIGLIKAVDTFNLDKNVAFSTYAIKCIYTELIKYINIQNKINDKEISYEIPISENDDLTILDFLDDKSTNIEKDYETIEQIEFINEMLEPLSDKEKLIINLRFGLNNYQPLEVNEIAKIFNVTRQYMYVIINDILLKIKKNMANYYKIKRTERRTAMKKYYNSNSSKKFDF